MLFVAGLKAKSWSGRLAKVPGATCVRVAVMKCSLGAVASTCSQLDGDLTTCWDMGTLRTLAPWPGTRVASAGKAAAEVGGDTSWTWFIACDAKPSGTLV